MTCLSPEETTHFHEQGWLKKESVFADSDLKPLADSITGHLDAECRQLVEKGYMPEELTFADEPFNTRYGKVFHALDRKFPKAQRVLLGAMGNLFLTGRWRLASVAEASGTKSVADTLLACIRHEPLLQCIESLVGPNILGSSVFRIRGKIPKWDPGEHIPYYTGHVPWHQDSGYYLAHCDKHLIVTCWIPLVDSTVENGCMYVLPWKKERGILKHHTGGVSSYLVIPEEEMPDPKETRPVAVEMKVGDVLFFTNMTPHASFDNKTDQTRWSMDLRYSNPEVPNNIDEAPENYTAERDPVTMACLPTEADFLIRDPQHPEKEVRDGKTFTKIRMRYANQNIHPGRGWTPLSDRPTRH